MDVKRRMAAEVFGTFWLVLGGRGAAVIAAGFPKLGIGFVGVALAFGLSVLTMAYAVGHISGGHFNPAVTVGLLVSGRFDKKDVAPYVAAQLVGAVGAAAVLYVIASGKAGHQLWLFWLAPLVGAALGGLIWRYLLEEGADTEHLAEGVA
jgi:aquaporin Z